jgi:stage V sporulation protein B
VEKQSSAKGFTILSAAGIITKLLGVLYVPFVTLILGNYGNGIREQGFKLYELVYVITNTGIPIALSKIISEQLASSRYRLSYKTLRVSAVLLASAGLFTSLLTVVLAGPMSELMYSPESYLAILALAPAVLFTSISCIFRGYFQGRSNMVPTSVSQIIEQAVNAVLAVLLSWLMYKYGIKIAAGQGLAGDAMIREALKYSAAGALIGTSAGALASALYLFRTFARKKADIISELGNSATDDTAYSASDILRWIIKLAVPITLGAVMVYVTQLIDVINTKSRLLAAGFGEVEATSMYGILGTQYTKVLFIPVAFATALSTTILPSISAADAVNDRTLLSRRISKAFKTILMISVPSAVGLTVMAKPIIGMLFPRSQDGWDLLMIGSWTLVLISLVSVQTAVLQGIGKTYIPTVHMVIGLVLKLIANYTLIAVKPINIKGAIIGNAVCYIFAAVMNYRAIKKYTGIRLNVKKLFNRPLSVSLIMGILVFFIYYGFMFMTEWFIKSEFVLNVACGGAAIASGALIYYLLMIMAGGITAIDIKSLPMGNRILAITSGIPFIGKYLR